VSLKMNPLVLKYMARRVLYFLMVLLAGFVFNGASHMLRDVHQTSQLGLGDTTICITYYSGWSLVSSPVRAPDGRTNVLFPSAGSNAFSYEGRYIKVDTIQRGMGYWLKTGAQPICFFGTILTTGTIDVVKGWNIIGSISFPVYVSAIIEVPSNIIASPFYGYRHGFFIATTIEPGQGYFVLVKENGRLILNSQSVKALK